MYPPIYDFDLRLLYHKTTMAIMQKNPFPGKFKYQIPLRKKLWEVYNEFCDLLEELHLYYNSQTFVVDGETMFLIQLLEKFDGYYRDRYGLRIYESYSVIRLGDMENSMMLNYERCINFLKNYNDSRSIT